MVKKIPGKVISEDKLNIEAWAFYYRILQLLNESGVPYLIGGAYAFGYYTGVNRHTEDLDVFIDRNHYEQIMQVFITAGCETRLEAPHWLGKACRGSNSIDIIFNSGTGVAKVDNEWFEYAVAGKLMGIPVNFCPPEEIIWSKSFLMERERYDGADVAHLLLACASNLDWKRLLRRFGTNWRVLLSHLILFGFIYPSDQEKVPTWIMDKLLSDLNAERHHAAPIERLCRGTLISRAQFLIDIEDWGYQDVRLVTQGE